MALITKVFNLFNLTATVQTKLMIPTGSGILTAIYVEAFPFTLDAVTGLAANSKIKFYIHDSAGNEFLGTDSVNSHYVSVDLSKNYSFLNIHRLELIDTAGMLSVMDAGAISRPNQGIYLSSLTLSAFGETANPHNIQFQLEVIEFD